MHTPMRAHKPIRVHTNRHTQAPTCEHTCATCQSIHTYAHVSVLRVSVRVRKRIRARACVHVRVRKRACMLVRMRDI